MTNLPPGWAMTTLGEIAESVRNGIFVSRPGTQPNGVPILRISAVRPGRLQLDDLRYSGADAASLAEADSLLEADDLLFTRYNGNADLVGSCALVPRGVGALTYPDKIIRVRVDDRVAVPRYVSYTFASPHVRTQVRSVARTTAGQAGISGSSLRSINLPLPPLAEQRRIVVLLDDHLSRLDAGTELLRRAGLRASTLMGQYADRRMHDLQHSVRTLGSVLREPLTNGRSVPTKDGGFPVLRLTAIRSGDLNPAERKGGRWTKVEAKQYLVRRGDFFVSRGNGSLGLVGRGALLDRDPDEVAFPDTMIRIRVDEELVSPRFLRLAWESRFVRRQIEERARTTAGIYKINQEILSELRIPVPAMATQDALVREVEDLTAVAPRSSVLDLLSARSRTLRSSLLRETFAGRLVPQDPQDEPASVLLERIRREQEVQPKARGRRRTAAVPQEEALL